MSFHKHFAVLPLLLAGAARAQEAQPESQQLEEIVVTASPLGRGADELVQPAQVLSAEELARKRRASLGETLEGELGVSSADFGPGVGRPVVRGQGGPRVGVLENGISSMDVSTISNDHAVGIDSAGADQVEIIKGPATLMFGSGSSAGVVNVVNNRIPPVYEEGWSGEVEFSQADNANETNGRAHFDLGAGGFMFHADGASRATESFDIPGAAGSDGSGSQGFLANSAVRSQSGAFGFARIADEGMLGASYSEYHTTYGLPNEPSAFIQLDQKRLDFDARLDDPLPGLESLKLRAGHNDYAHTEFEEPGVPGTLFFNNETEVRLQAVHRPMGAVRGAVGVQLVDRRFEAIGDEAFVQPVRTRSQGLFWVGERPFGAGRFELGARVEQQTHTPAAVRPADGSPNVDPRTGALQPRVEHTPVSVSAGVLLELGEHHHLRLNLSRAQRAPAAEELFAFGPHIATGTFERGNAGFTEETAQNVELGIDRHDARWTWSASVYYNRIADFVFLQEADANLDADGSTGGDATGIPDGEPDSVMFDGTFVAPASVPALPAEEREELVTLVDYRQADATFVGAEVETAFDVLEGPANLEVRLFGDLVRAELDDGGNLPRITPPRYGAGLRGDSGPWAGALVLTRVARQSQVSTLEAPTDGHSLLSADLSWTGTLGSLTPTLFLRGRNLLDEEARRHTSFLKDVAPMPGRAVVLGMSVKF